ncbi:hypothetical protein Z043_104230 [Scleropages formosus]|uniref:Adenomatous polyposis coli protein-like n=1 Tax=Scleropages formosus TaxID=113540 RepID=A0A0P7VRS4_SCLFO|nr:hypothetical protein Z043_104230 [Scleropages formosus]
MALTNLTFGDVANKESTLKSVLSALWNLSAHCTENKADICSVNGALAFLVSTLTYRSQTNTLAIIESGGGILRNVSSLIATNEDHSLSALSLDEPYIQKDVELQIMPPVHEDDHGNEGDPEKDESVEARSPDKAKIPCQPEKDILDDSDDDDIEILEACINSAMPTKSSRKPKKQSLTPASRIPPPVARKPSQLPVYKLLPSQNRGQQQKHVSFTHGEDMPKIYCVEGTPINFSTATSLSDLTIDSPPNELASNENSVHTVEPSCTQREVVLKGKTTEVKSPGQSPSTSKSVVDENNEGDDILAECISSAMPKDQEEMKEKTSNKGPRILKPGEKSTLESKKKEEEAKGLKGAKASSGSHDLPWKDNDSYSRGEKQLTQYQSSY